MPRSFHLVPALALAGVLTSTLAFGQAAGPGTLTLAMPIEPPNLDPTTGAAAAIREVTYRNIYEGLTRIDRSGAVQPALAKSWTLSDDGLTYRFTLESGVTFHDGSPLTSADVKFSLDRARAPDSTNAQKQLFEPIAEVATPDAQTVVITLKRPTGLFLWNLGWGDAVIFSEKSAATNITNPIGTGAFKFAAWTRGDRVVLEKNPAYRAAAQVKLDKVIFRFIGDAQAQAAALKAGEVDAMPNLGAPELFEDFQKDPRFKTVAGSTEGEIVAGFNNARKPLDDARVRRALTQAVDRKALVDAAYNGIGQPIGSHFSPGQPGYIDLTSVLPYDPKAAKAALATAGYPNGFSLTLRVPQMTYARRSAEVMAAMFQDIGVTLTLEPIEFPGQWLDQVFKRTDYDMTIVAHTEPLDIGIYARDAYYFNYQNAPMKAIMAEVNATADTPQRLALLGKAQKQLAEDAPALFLFLLPKLGVWNAKLKGLWDNQPIPANDVVEVSWH